MIITNLLRFLTDAFIGFDNTDIFLVESEGPAVLTISFQDPIQISPDVQVTLNLVTVDDTAIGKSSSPFPLLLHRILALIRNITLQ